MAIDPYWFIISASLIIIVSYLFTIIASRTSIPSVLLLIFTGFLIRQGLQLMGFGEISLLPILEVLGIIGLILIVLEASLDLKLEKSKWPMIVKSFILALVILLVTSFACAYIIYFFLGIDYYTSLIYAVPISIMSSAIIIPSVTNLVDEKREFMIYESTFSDILGIIMFYILIDTDPTQNSNFYSIPLEAILNIALTVIIAVIVSFSIILLLQRITSRMKLFLSFAILLLIYSIGKLMHLSSLIIILIFGLILNNREIFVRGILKKKIKRRFLLRILNDFKFITSETAFLIRTFFFVIFGMSIAVSTLNNVIIYEISILLLIALYLIRYFNMKWVLGAKVFPELYIAPRGLITILLFFSIPEELMASDFESGILLLVILSTNVIMMVALMITGNKLDAIADRVEEPTFPANMTPGVKSLD
ncbi:MAG: cell volume regulation protein A [Sphingobacteriales bacterium]|jgi:cell volume regulation protein A